MQPYLLSFVNGELTRSMLQVWGLSPLLITLLSFWCFITLGHGQLTVSTAFTSLSLYQVSVQKIWKLEFFLDQLC